MPTKPVKCVCGREPTIREGLHFPFTVTCSDDTCWCGPARVMEKGAVVAWNSVMRPARDAKRAPHGK